jgi:hypothetical protein
MPVNRRQFLSRAALTAAALKAAPKEWMLAENARAGAAPSDRSYGSGYFGKWIEDEFGLPAFHYTCDQTRDPKARTELNPGILTATEHISQIGNDRIVALASNYGHVRVRQDEGAPKFLNDYAPEHGCFAGGFGYLTDGKAVLSTYYPGNAKSFDRVFGAGYFRKKVHDEPYGIDQVVFAPFGDDPVLLSQVTITNSGGNDALDRILGMPAVSVFLPLVYGRFHRQERARSSPRLRHALHEFLPPKLGRGRLKRKKRVSRTRPG